MTQPTPANARPDSASTKPVACSRPNLPLRRILTLDASTARWTAGLVEDDVVLGATGGDDVAALPMGVVDLLAAHGRQLDLVAVVVGPGSFTGLRASVALAHGIALAGGIDVVGITAGSALELDGAAVWVAVDDKRGRVFLERDGAVHSLALDALPLPVVPIVLGGDAALAAGEALAMRGATVRLHPAPLPEPRGIAHAAAAGRTRPALPLYVEPPAARPGLPGRPAPA